MDGITQLLMAIGNNPMPQAYPGEENITRDAYIKMLLAKMYGNFQGNKIQPQATPTPLPTNVAANGIVNQKPIRQPNYGNLDTLFAPTPTPSPLIRR